MAAKLLVAVGNVQLTLHAKEQPLFTVGHALAL